MIKGIRFLRFKSAERNIFLTTACRKFPIEQNPSGRISEKLIEMNDQLRDAVYGRQWCVIIRFAEKHTYLIQKQIKILGLI